MKTIVTLVGCLIGSCLFAGQVCAQSALVHIQGDQGNREAYFANFNVVFDRTPMDKILGPVQVRELDTTIVYEHPDKPEFSDLRLQFECVAKQTYDGKSIPQPAFDAPVRVRVGEGSWKLRREDIKSENLPAGEWRTSSSPVLLKLHKVACNEDVLRNAIIKAATAKNVDLFKKDIETIGLPSDFQLISQQRPPDYLTFAWTILWLEAKRPDPTGKWSRRPTKKETEEYNAKMEQLKKQYDQVASGIKSELEANIKKMDGESAFKKLAADIREGRRLSRNEFHMLTVWEGKTETDVGATMGAPITSTAGKLSFLSYGNEFDNRVIVGNRQGAVWEEGLYEHCNVQFVMHPDSNNTPRVVDVRIWASSNQIGKVRFACDGLLEVPK
ncbi:MAG: hypothetical protein IT389_15445 [Nitrospira sp.]|nr:hypothetical protein [Nitrospira sp.]